MAPTVPKAFFGVRIGTKMQTRISMTMPYRVYVVIFHKRLVRNMLFKP